MKRGRKKPRAKLNPIGLNDPATTCVPAEQTGIPGSFVSVLEAIARGFCELIELQRETPRRTAERLSALLLLKIHEEIDRRHWMWVRDKHEGGELIWTPEMLAVTQEVMAQGFPLSEADEKLFDRIERAQSREK